jgi:hypothetical protein
LARGRPEAGGRRGWPWWRRWAAWLAAGDGRHAWVRDSGAYIGGVRAGAREGQRGQGEDDRAASYGVGQRRTY